MKKNVLKIRLVILVMFLQLISISVNCQIKVGNNGYVGIGSAATPNKSIDVKGYVYKFSRKNGSSNYVPLEINHWGHSPRMGSSKNIAFYYRSDYVNIHCKTVFEYSNRANKEQITSLTGEGLNKVLKLKGVSYYWKNEDTCNRGKNKKEIGFIAQDIEKVIPEVVYTIDSTNQKMLAYTHIIPYLAEAIKELNDKIVILEKELANNDNRKSSVIMTKSDNIGYSDAKLYQNKPNPFNENTVIKYDIPNDCQSATINIFDMQGVPVKNIRLSITCNGKVLINSNELNAGMYIYTLIVDGVLIDSKNMILTKN